MIWSCSIFFSFMATVSELFLSLLSSSLSFCSGKCHHSGWEAELRPPYWEGGTCWQDGAGHFASLKDEGEGESIWIVMGIDHVTLGGRGTGLVPHLSFQGQELPQHSAGRPRRLCHLVQRNTGTYSIIVCNHYIPSCMGWTSPTLTPESDIVRAWSMWIEYSHKTTLFLSDLWCGWWFWSGLADACVRSCVFPALLASGQILTGLFLKT